MVGDGSGFAVRRLSDGWFLSRAPGHGFRWTPKRLFIYARTRSKACIAARVDLGLSDEDFEIVTREELESE